MFPAPWPLPTLLHIPLPPAGLVGGKGAQRAWIRGFWGPQRPKQRSRGLEMSAPSALGSEGNLMVQKGLAQRGLGD